MKMKREEFIQTIKEGYTCEGEYFTLGGAMLGGECIKDCYVNIPLEMMNRHGLISGATGTGKSKTLQIIAEQLSQQGVPVLLMDVKGDLSGIAKAAEVNEGLLERHESIGIPFTPSASPIEFLSISDEPGVRMRATVTEFGPILLSKILGLNELQTGIMAVVFKYCDDNQLPLVDLNDLRKTLQYLSGEGKEKIEKKYGRISSSSVGAMVRKLVVLQQQGAELFFGEPSFDVKDLLRVNEEGRGIVNILRVTDIQRSPKLFSTFMLQLLAEVYHKFPEEGDMAKPKLVMFIDEAHLVFEEASDVLLKQIESTIKLIRSKGVGIYFITQNPTDIPDDVLSQLGLKIQHALRAFTAKDREELRKAAKNYPITEFYDVEEVMTNLGIGEALVTVLNEDGIPTPLVRTLLRAPESRMDILTPLEIKELEAQSTLIDKYAYPLDRASAADILEKKIQRAQSPEVQEELKETQEKAEKETTGSGFSWFNVVKDFMDTTAGRQIGRTFARELVRGLFGILGK